MTTKLNFKQSLLAGLLAGAAAAALNAALFLVFHATGVINDNIYVKPDQPLSLGPVIMASIIPLLVAGMVFFLFERFTKNGFRIFSIVSLVLMVLSLYSPFTVIPGVTTGYALVLCAMHIVATLSLLYFINRAKQGSKAAMSYNPI